ncbi:MAG: polysaccharide deacetylase family protein [Nitrococcus sp.]|nr:polysaccharide deacetylase family protein [Nitrococcus sp.]
MSLSSFKSRLRGYLARHSAVVIAYHNVYTHPQPFAAWHHMSVDSFEEQIAHIARHYRCISAADLLANLARGRNDPYSVVVTFDDGFASNLHVALPILERFHVPATFFIVSDLVEHGGSLWPDRLACIIGSTDAQTGEFRGTVLSLRDAASKGAAYRSVVKICKGLPSDERNRLLTELVQHLLVDEAAFHTQAWWEDYRIMSAEEVALLSRSPLVEIGAHTVSHPVLSRIDADHARREIAGSKWALEQLLGRVRYFAYPYGGADDYTPLHRQMCLDAGYEAAFSAKLGAVIRGTDCYEIPRMGIGGDTRVSDLEYALSGGVAVASRQVQWV